jgi:hypothetical protein
MRCSGDDLQCGFLYKLGFKLTGTNCCLATFAGLCSRPRQESPFPVTVAYHVCPESPLDAHAVNAGVLDPEWHCAVGVQD